VTVVPLPRTADSHHGPNADHVPRTIGDGRDCDRGGAMLLVLLFTVLLTTLGTGLVAVANTERVAANHLRTGVELGYVADAMAAHVVSELSARSQWTTALCCQDRSVLTDPTLAPRTSWGEILDFSTLTTGLRTQADAAITAGANAPRWQLYAWAPADRLLGPVRMPAYVAAWVADDAGDGDADAVTDGNGTVLVLARAFGPVGLRRDVRLVLTRQSLNTSETGTAGAGRARIASWREVQ
jgi:hypothetical protein